MWSALRDKKVVSWAFYDFANSAFATTILAVIFNKYFALEVAGGEKGIVLLGYHVHGATFFTMIVSLSMAVTAVVSPILGAIADFSRHRKGFLAVFSYLGITFTALLYFVGPGDVWTGALFFVLANIGFSGGCVFYNAFLPQISTPATLGRVSGLGWALGYIGGGVVLILNLFMLSGFEVPLLGYLRFSVHACFVSVAVWWALFSLPMFLWVPELGTREEVHGKRHYFAVGLSRVTRTISKMKQFRQLSFFLIAFLLYNDGIETVVVMTSIFAADVLGMGTKEIIVLFLFVQAVAFAGAITFGHIEDRVGHKRTILGTLVIWIVAVVWTFFLGWLFTPRLDFWIVCFLAGLVLGGSQSASRALQGLLTPTSHSAEFFGFFSISGRFASIFGTLSYGLVISLTGSLRWGILSIALFFIAGAVFLLQVDEKAGIEEKNAYDRESASNVRRMPSKESAW